jgi:hypothetical protein
LKQVWWVNLSKDVSSIITAGVLWAPLISKNGKRLFHWDLLEQFKPGDIVLGHSAGSLQYVGRVTASAILSPPPLGLGDLWHSDGRLVRVEFTALDYKIPGNLIGEAVSELGINKGPFSRAGKVLQGYAFNFSWGGLRLIMEFESRNTWPSYVLTGLADCSVISEGV